MEYAEALMVLAQRAQIEDVARHTSSYACRHARLRDGRGRMSLAVDPHATVDQWRLLS